MKINSYSFGKISVSNKIFNSDLIIFPNSIQDNWWREKGHLLQKADLNTVIDYEPDLLIIGTGKYGRMKVPDNLINELKNIGMSIEVYKTDKAVKKYENINKKDVVCALHLTC